jgi:hypothetical protein
MRARHHVYPGRLAAAALLVGVATAVSAAQASAAELPDPLSASVARVTAGLSGAPVGGVAETGEDAVEPLVGGTGEEDGGPGQAEGTTSDSSASGSTGSDGQTAPASADEPERSPDAPGSSGQPSGAASPGSLRASTPVASVCVIPAGAASPAFEIDLQAAGIDLSSPLIEQFPQAFAACPGGAVPVDEATVAAVDAVVEGLLGACIRVTREVAPLQTTLIVLDRNVIEELTQAGLPLEKLVMPCPDAGDGGADGGDRGSGSQSGAAGSTPRSQAASAAPALPSGLAFTGANTGPLLALATALLCAGALLSRKAWLLARR